MSKKLLLIATGGTIASRPAEDGLTPEMTSEELLQCKDDDLTEFGLLVYLKCKFHCFPPSNIIL